MAQTQLGSQGAVELCHPMARGTLEIGALVRRLSWYKVRDEVFPLTHIPDNVPDYLRSFRRLLLLGHYVSCHCLLEEMLLAASSLFRRGGSMTAA